MTRKDYILIAAAIKEALEDAHVSCEEGISLAASYLGHKLALDNPRFDYDRFLAACGIAD